MFSSAGKVDAGGRFFARGACDEKGSTPGMVYGLAIARDLGLLEGYTAYYFGNMEEWCDGIAPNTFVEFPGVDLEVDQPADECHHQQQHREQYSARHDEPPLHVDRAVVRFGRCAPSAAQDHGFLRENTGWHPPRRSWSTALVLAV